MCDGTVHCPKSGDDEKLCHYSRCPQNCSCAGWAMHCNTINATIPTQLGHRLLHFSLQTKLKFLPFKNILVSMTRLLNLELKALNLGELPQNIFYHHKHLIRLDLRYNNIHVVNPFVFQGLESMSVLLLAGNPIFELRGHSFAGCTSLSVLDVSELAISILHDCSFCGMDSLAQLNLSGNNLRYISAKNFLQLTTLQSLDLTRNPLSEIELESYDHFPLGTFVFLDNARFCCLKPTGGECISSAPTPALCNDLLSSKLTVRLFFGAIGVSVFTLNAVTLLWNSIYRGENTQGLIVSNQAVADLILGCLLLSTLIADKQFSGKFFMKQTQWRSGVTCRLVGTFTSAALYLTTVFYFLLTLDRFLKILRIADLNKKQVMLMITFAWVLCLLGVVIRNIYIGIDNDYCISLITEYYAVDISLLLVELILVAGALAASIKIIKYCIQTRRAVKRDISQEDKGMFRRLLLCPMLYCLFLSLKLLLILGKWEAEFESILLLVIVAVVPLINPITFTVSTKSFVKWARQGSRVKR